MNKKLHFKNLYSFVFIFVLMVTVKTNLCSQTLSESFEGSTFPPTGWTIVNYSQVPYDWAQQIGGTAIQPTYTWGNFIAPNATTGGGNNYAISSGDAFSSCDQWLISPAITINLGDSLKFYLMMVDNYGGILTDNLDILVSTTTNSTSSFTSSPIASFNESSLSNSVWNYFAYNLSSYAGQTIYIAFREYFQVAGMGFGGVGFSVDLVTVGTSVPQTYLPNALTATPSNICSGSSSTLGMTGGTLLTGDYWMWYTGSCGGTLIASGSSVTVSPTSLTTYYLRAEGSTNTTSCMTITINVSSTSSTDPTSVSVVSPICPGTTTTLGVVGGSLAPDANWVWYAYSCGGTYISSAIAPVLSPTSITAYFVRAEGACNTTQCANASVFIATLSTVASSATASPSTINSGASTTLTVNGGNLGGANDNWVWYIGQCGDTYVCSGASTIQTPGYNTTYYVRAEGPCNTTACVNVAVIVNQTSIQSISDIANDLVISPNPVKDIATFKFNSSKDGLVKIEIYNVLGTKVSDVLNNYQSKGAHKSTVDLSKLSSGIYSVKMTIDNKATILRKLIVY